MQDEATVQTDPAAIGGEPDADGWRRRWPAVARADRDGGGGGRAAVAAKWPRNRSVIEPLRSYRAGLTLALATEPCTESHAR